MRDYDFDFEKLREDHPIFPCDFCPWSRYCDTLDEDGPSPCVEQAIYNQARAARRSMEY